MSQAGPCPSRESTLRSVGQARRPPTSALRRFRRRRTGARRPRPQPTCPSQQLSIRHKELAEVVATWRELGQAGGDVAHCPRDARRGVRRRSRRASGSSSSEPKPRSPASSARLRALLLPKDPNDGRNVIVEIRGAEGARRRTSSPRICSRCTSVTRTTTDGGVEVLSEERVRARRAERGAFLVKGADAWRCLEHEGGPHRVQRVPVTESKGRVHTSSATVTVLPEADEVDVAHRSRRPEDRRLSLDRARWSVGEHHRLGSADHAPSRPASSWPCRTRRARSRTGPRRWWCFAPAC